MLTPEQLEKRRQFITASDVASIMNVSPWANAATVYYHKTEGIIPKTNPSMEMGSHLEQGVLSWASTLLGPLSGGGEWRVHENGIIAATLDDRTQQGNPVEAKTSGLIGFTGLKEWGADYTDDIPNQYLIQVQCQLLVDGADLAYVPALIGGRGFAMFVVEAKPKLQALIKLKCERFWNDHVERRIPPDDVTPDLEVIKRIVRTKGKAVTIPGELVEAYELINERKKEAVKAQKAAQAKLLAALGDAEIGTYVDAEGDEKYIDYREIPRKGYTVKSTTYRRVFFREGNFEDESDDE